MLPNLNGLALAPSPTGVVVNPDGSVTLTPEEWANLTRLIGEPSAPAPAPAPAPTHRGRLARRVRYVDSSSSEDERPLAARAPRAPARQRRRTAAPPSRTTVLHDDADTMSDLLKADDLAAILGAIGMTDRNKSAACQEAKAWCGLNTEHKGVCDSNPQVWQSLVERIFDPGPVDKIPVVLGKRLIYDTFKDDANPQKAFLSMCGATGLADVLEKRFVMLASKLYGEMLWDIWADVRADVTGLGDAIELLSTERVNELAERHYPNIFKTDEWEVDAKALFDRAPPKALYLDKYRNNRTFSKLVDNLFQSTAKYLFVDPGGDQHDYVESVRDALYMIGEMLGIYIVCLWKLERDRSNFEDKHSADRDPMPDDVLAVHLDEMDVFIQNLRVQVAYAIDLILDPTNALVENQDYDPWADRLRTELYDYESDDAFDVGMSALRLRV